MSELPYRIQEGALASTESSQRVVVQGVSSLEVPHDQAQHLGRQQASMSHQHSHTGITPALS